MVMLCGYVVEMNSQSKHCQVIRTILTNTLEQMSSKLDVRIKCSYSPEMHLTPCLKEIG